MAIESELEQVLRTAALRVTRPRMAVLRAGSVARYEARVGDNHHHLVCRSCGAIVDVDCAVGPTPCLTAAEDWGFVVDEAEVVYWGLCPTCAAGTS